MLGQPSRTSLAPLRPPPSALPKPTTSLKVDKNGLYMLMNNTGLQDKYHWGLLVATSDNSGIVFHKALFGAEWKLVIEPKSLSETSDLLAALKLGVIEDISEKWIDRMKECVRGVRVQGELTCRTWALTALYELANEGFIGMIADWGRIRSIEQEAKFLAQDAWVTRAKFVTTSKWSVP